MPDDLDFKNTNPKDPMMKAAPDAGQQLLRAFGQVAHQFPRDVVINAAANLLVNVLRQTYDSRQKAEPAFDEVFGRTKQILMNHYDAYGRRKGIFPYHQIIRPQPFVDKDADGFSKVNDTKK